MCMFAIAMKRADPTRQPLPAEMPSLPITDMKPMPYVSPHLFDMLPVPAIEQLVFGVLHACCHTHTQVWSLGRILAGVAKVARIRDVGGVGDAWLADVIWSGHLFFPVEEKVGKHGQSVEIR